MNFVSETRNKSGTKNGFLGKSSFFVCITFHSFHLLAIKAPIQAITMLSHPDSIYVFHISRNSQRKEKSIVFNDRYQYVQS